MLRAVASRGRARAVRGWRVSEREDAPAAAPARRDSAALGALLLAAGHLLACLVAALLPIESPVAVFLVLIGACQLVYAIPLFLVLRRRGLGASASGVVLGACVTLLLNAGCWGIAVADFSTTR